MLHITEKHKAIKCLRVNPEFEERTAVDSAWQRTAVDSAWQCLEGILYAEANRLTLGLFQEELLHAQKWKPYLHNRSNTSKYGHSSLQKQIPFLSTFNIILSSHILFLYIRNTEKKTFLFLFPFSSPLSHPYFASIIKALELIQNSVS